MNVETYSSFAYAVEPRSFDYEGARHTVQSITRTWRTPGQIHFYVRDHAAEFFELTYNEHQDTWSTRSFGKTCPPLHKQESHG